LPALRQAKIRDISSARTAQPDTAKPDCANARHPRRCVTRARFHSRSSALWAEQRDIADVATLREIAATPGAGSFEPVREVQDAGMVAEW